MASVLGTMCSTYNVNPSVVARHCAEVFCSEDFENFTISCMRCSTEYNLFSCKSFANHIRECFADNDSTNWKVFSEDLPKTLIKTEATNELLSTNVNEDANTSVRGNLCLDHGNTKVPLQENICPKSEFLIEEVSNSNHKCQKETTIGADLSNTELFNQNDFILSVISEYKDNPSLWDVNLSSFFDIHNRKQGYLDIAKLLSIQFNTKATDADIKKLIARLRAEYRRAQRSKGTSNRVWYYDNLSFLDVKFELLKLPDPHSACHNDNLNDDAASPTSNYRKKRVRRVVEVPLKCDQCNLEFNTRRELTNHKNEVHPTRFKCDYCDYTAKERFNINTHMKRHKGINRFPCEFCGKKFVTSTERNVHSRTHTGEKPYVCEFCGTAFRLLSFLTVHLRRHSNQRDFKCEECGKEFFTNQALRRHMVVHRDERPYKCETCNAAFKQPKTLKQHMTLHMPVKRYSCTICEKKFAQPSGLLTHKKTHSSAITVEA